MRHVFLRDNVLFAALQSFYWCAFCMTSTFLVLYLEANGYEKGHIGAILSASSVAVLFGQYFWGSYCYKFEWLSHKNIILLCMLVGIGVNMLLPVIVSYFFLTLIVYSLFTFTFSSIAPMIDAWVMFRRLDTPAINYGMTRGFGSGVYAFAAIYFGSVLSQIGISYMFLFSSIFLVAGMLTTALIHRGKAEEARLVSSIAGLGASAGLMRNSRFVLFFISVLIIFTASIANASFYGLLITELGGNSGHFGTGIFVMAISEVPVMFVSAWLLTRIAPQRLLVCSFFFFLLKAALLAASETLTFAIFAQVAQSLSFGLFLPVCVAYLHQIVRKSENTVAYMLISSACYGFGGIIGNAYGGFVSQHYSLGSLYELNMYITAAGFILFIVSAWKRKGISIDHDKKMPFESSTFSGTP